MKSLLIMRHAKSSWKNPGLEDHDRPLNDRGKRDAPRMGQFLSEQGLVPDVIISSTAKRARKTAAEVARTSGFESEVELEPEFYHGEIPAWIERLHAVPKAAQVVMMVGHNPGFEDFVLALTGSEEPLPTATIAHVQLPIHRWSDLHEDTRGVLAAVWRPKEIQRGGQTSN